jgi:hypothetical protein
MNGDGKLDLVTGNYGSDNVSLLFGNGDGTFQSARNFSAGSGSGPNGIAVGDFNGDGRPDIAVADQNSGTASVLLSNLVSATAGQTFTAPLATFTDANPLAQSSNFTATVYWGDTTSSVIPSSMITEDANGVFTVNGGHAYAQAGVYDIVVVIQDVGGSTTQVSNVVSVHV